MITDRNSYLQWLAIRRGVCVEGCNVDDAGFYRTVDRKRVDVLRMPGYGQSATMVVEELDAAGEVIRASTLGLKPNGSIPFDKAKVKELQGGAIAKADHFRLPALQFYRGERLPEGVSLPRHAKLSREQVRAIMTDRGAMLAYLDECRPVGMPVEAAAPPVEHVEAPAAVPLPNAGDEALETGSEGWKAFVGDRMACPAEGWRLSKGPQRDRKARNRGLMVISKATLNALRREFDVAQLPPEPRAPSIYAPYRPEPDVVPESTSAAISDISGNTSPAPEPSLAGEVAALVAMVADLAARVAGASVPAARLAEVERERDDARAGLAEVRSMLAERVEAVKRAGELLGGKDVRINRAEYLEARGRMRRKASVQRARRLIADARASADLNRRALAITNAAHDIVRADLARLQPLANALQGLIPATPPAEPIVKLVTSNGRPLERVA